MLRRITLVFFAVLLSACTLVPDAPPAPTQVCPVCEPCTQCTPIYIEITSTPAPTIPPTATETPLPQPSATETPILPTPPPTLVPPQALFQAQPGTPVFIENFTHPELGCNWMGVAGQVFLADGESALNLVVVVSGELGGQAVDMITLTGLAPAYGPGGFEFTLANQPVASQGTLFIQLFDLEGVPLSGAVPLETSGTCAQNLLHINFSPISG